MNDVLPDGKGGWLARCECGATRRHAAQDEAWQWVLGHPCPDSQQLPAGHPEMAAR